MSTLQLFRVDDVEGIELLRWEDQQKIRKHIEGQAGAPLNVSSPAAVECGIEVSQTSRASCRHCNQKIMKGEVCLCVYCIDIAYAESRIVQWL